MPSPAPPRKRQPSSQAHETPVVGGAAAQQEILGRVEAPDAAAAKVAAAVRFELDDVQRRRIIVEELG
jgi:hypothetical protein